MLVANGVKHIPGIYIYIYISLVHIYSLNIASQRASLVGLYARAGESSAGSDCMEESLRFFHGVSRGFSSIPLIMVGSVVILCSAPECQIFFGMSTSTSALHVEVRHIRISC